MKIHAGSLLALQLACLAGAQAAGQAATSDLATCAALRAADQRLACYDHLAESLGIAPAAPPQALRPAEKPAAPALTADGDDPRFGLTKPLATEPRGPQSLSAIVKTINSDTVNNVYVLLDNGQTWTFNPSDLLLLRPGDAVTIKKAALGSFMMVTPSKRSYHVRRMQ